MVGGPCWEDLLNCLPPPLLEEDNNLILVPISKEEVKSVVFSMGPFKAPGPNGFPPTFFQDFWDVDGLDVVLATRDFFRSGRLLNKLNHTFISHVPKTQEASTLKDFSPISL